MSAEQAPKPLNVPDINAEIQLRGPEFLLGMDTQRLWANGIQTFIIDELALIVFREQNLLPTLDGKSVTGLKNVASIVVSTTVLREFYSILGQALQGSSVNVG